MGTDQTSTHWSLPVKNRTKWFCSSFYFRQKLRTEQVRYITKPSADQSELERTGTGQNGSVRASAAGQSFEPKVRSGTEPSANRSKPEKLPVQTDF